MGVVIARMSWNISPDGYEAPADQQGNLQKITYNTWESFTYDQKSQKLTKEAWVYVPYGYDENKKVYRFLPEPMAGGAMKRRLWEPIKIRIL